MDEFTHGGDALNPERENHDLGVKVKYYGDVVPLSDISFVPEAVSKSEEPNFRTRVYTDKSNVDEVREVVEGLE